MNTIKIISHNVLHWPNRSKQLTQLYLKEDPHVIIINGLGCKNSSDIAITGFYTYIRNSSEELHDGSAMLIKQNIKHKIDENFTSDIISLSIETSLGIINISTTYLPPRRPFLPYPDFHRLASYNNASYIIGDFNAKHNILGHNTNNAVGTGIARFINDQKLNHFGPNFPTFIRGITQTDPDIVLTNNNCRHNLSIEPGPLTTSDHIPLILKITARPLTIPRTERYDLKRVNWEQFRDIITATTNEQDTHTREDMAIEEIDRQLDNWYKAIKKGLDGTARITKK